MNAVAMVLLFSYQLLPSRPSLADGVYSAGR